MTTLYMIKVLNKETIIKDLSNNANIQYSTRDELLRLSGKDKIKVCLDKYRSIGLCKNIIDLMSDFISEGVAFSHHDKSQERFWQEWCKKINLVDRSERYANNLLKSGLVVLRRSFGKLEYSSQKGKISKNIPLQYTFINVK